MTGYNPDNWLDLLGLLILGAAFIGAAAVPAWISHRRQNKKLGAIEEQVVNDHGPDGKDQNLRTQIDRLIELGEENRVMNEENRAMISGLHEDLREERQERREGIAALRGDIQGLKRGKR